MRIFIALFLFMIIKQISHADTNEQMVISQMQQLQGSFGVNNAGEFLGYSENEAMKTGEDLDNLSDAELKNKAGQKMEEAQKEKGTAPENITVIAGQCPTLTGYENQEMFTKADEIFKDPITMLNKLSDVKCKKILGQNANHYTRKTVKQTKYDTEIEEQICEQPAGNIVCENTLDLECEEMQDCQNKTIMINSISPELIAEKSDLGIGIKIKKDRPHRNDLHILNTSIDFKIIGSERVNKFLLSKINSNVAIRILLNGVEVFNSLNSKHKFEVYVTRKKESVYRHSRGDYEYYGEREYEVRDLGSNGYTYNYWEGITTNNIDLKNFLQEGDNRIEIEIPEVEPRYSEVEIEIETKQQCCNKFKDVWVERCWQE